MTVLGGDDTMSLETELSRDISGNLNVFFTDSDDENEFSNEGNLVEEKKLEEIMQELYKEITNNASPPPPPVTFQSPSHSSLFSSPLAVSSSKPFFSVSCDVKSESCGASMSDSSSSVMAGIEFVGPAKILRDVKKAGLPDSGKEVWAMGGGEDEEMKGCDEEEAGEVGDDQWLARVLRWGPLELEEWT